MATLIDAVTNMPDTGNCSLNLTKATALFDKHCLITSHFNPATNQNSYRLHRSKTKAKNFKGLKLTISNEDALFLIDALKLVKVQSATFRNAATFYHKDYLVM